MTLGAQRDDVLRLILEHGTKVALIGVAIGTAVALGLSRFLSGLLYGVKPTASADVPRRDNHARPGHTVGLLHPCTPRDARRSHGCPEIRVIHSRC
jgi:hypothetical protein